jgi:hypothetical protein
MAAPKRVVQAVQAGIVASAHLNAFQHVMAAAAACERLGGLTSGRWRSAARDLDALQDKLQTALSGAIEELTSRADDLGVPEDALWAVGDAAATLDLLRESALDGLDDDESLAGRIIDGEVLFGASFIEDPDLPDRGTTLLFGWSDPLSPASWPWQANWIVGDTDDTDDDEDDSDVEDQGEELDLFEAGEPEGEDSLLPDLADQLGCSPEEARAALRRAAMALTRASLLAANGDADEEEDDEDDEANGAI